MTTLTDSDKARLIDAIVCGTWDDHSYPDVGTTHGPQDPRVPVPPLRLRRDVLNQPPAQAELKSSAIFCIMPLYSFAMCL